MTEPREPGDPSFWKDDAESLRVKSEDEALDALDDLSEPAEPVYRRVQETVVDWARAIALGIRDTAKDVVDEGRSGARKKQSEMWDRFDDKTKGRRTRH